MINEAVNLLVHINDFMMSYFTDVLYHDRLKGEMNISTTEDHTVGTIDLYIKKSRKVKVRLTFTLLINRDELLDNGRTKDLSEVNVSSVSMVCTISKVVFVNGKKMSGKNVPFTSKCLAKAKRRTGR